MWGSLIGAGASLLGGALGGGSSMPKFRPADVTTGLGTADWDKKGKNLNATLSPEMQAYANLLNQNAMMYGSGGGPTAGFQNFAFNDVQGMFPGLFSGALDASGVDTASLGQYLQQMGGLGGSMAGAMNYANAAGQNFIGGGGPGGAMAGSMFGLGQSLLGSSPQSYQDVYQNRLGLLREQAAPFEERAGNSFLQRQYNMGRMGSTGGGRDVEAFSRGLSQADTTRQLDAMNLSEALYGRDLSAALQRQGIGAGLMGQGASTYLSQAGLGQGLLGLGGSFGSALGNIYGAGYGAQQGMNELVNTRAQQRMQNASNLFGFGNQLSQQDVQSSIGLNQAQRDMYAQLQSQGQLGAQTGAARMGSGTPIPQGGFTSALGGALMGFGNAALANPGMFNMGGNAGLFGQHNVGLSGAQLSNAYSQLNQLPVLNMFGGG